MAEASSKQGHGARLSDLKKPKNGEKFEKILGEKAQKGFYKELGLETMESKYDFIEKERQFLSVVKIIEKKIK